MAMADLDARFESLRRARPPDLWPDIERRDPRQPVEPPPSPARRAGVAIVALAVAAAAIVFVARAFREAEPLPGLGTPVEVTPRSNGRMVFLAEQGDTTLLLSDVFVAGPEGEQPQGVLATGSGNVTEVAWSPDGSRIAYLRSLGVGGGGEIVSVAADGSDPRTLVRTDQDVLQGFAWSPDGEWVVYSRGVDVGDDIDYSLFARPVAGGEEVQLTDGVADDVDPAWSPDGTQLVFSRDEGQGGSDLFVIDAEDGSNLTKITGRGGAEAEPAWSPDGTRIAFSTGTRIESVRADGTERWVLYSCGPGRAVRHPTWSPDGELIAVTQIEGDHMSALILRVDRLDAGVLVPFTAPPSPVFASACCVSWEPLPSAGGVSLETVLCGLSTGVGDLDGDGRIDRARMFAETSGGPATCRIGTTRLEVRFGSGSVLEEELSPCRSYLCAILGSTDLDRDGRDELVVDVGPGAAAAFASLFLVDPAGATQLTVASPGDGRWVEPGPATFGGPHDSGAQSGFGCSPIGPEGSRAVEVRFAVHLGDGRMRVHRTTLILLDTEFEVVDTHDEIVERVGLPPQIPLADLQGCR
jgi:TolB protein